MSAETDLLANLKEYEIGTVANVATSIKNGAITDKNTLAMMQYIQYVPYVGQILKIGQVVTDAIVKGAGAGSFAGRMATVSFPLSGNLLTKPYDIVKALFSGRTYNSDQYYGASDFSFYVKGIDVGSSVHVTDADVIPAMKWYIDKLGIFISGSAHVNALRKSVQDYINMAKVNAYTTTDVTRVTAAREVVLQYMPYNYVLKQWAMTKGVFDEELLSLAKKGYNDYQSSLLASKQGYQATNSTDVNTLLGTDGTSSTLIYVFAAVVIIIILIIILK